ncbi:MAG: hypothetical protein ABIZ05_17310 [Pseudonocardiaceae bacterium]
MSESEVDEVDSGVPDEDVSGLEVGVPPAQSVQRSQSVMAMAACRMLSRRAGESSPCRASANSR